jgi:hypothetical protein
VKSLLSTVTSDLPVIRPRIVGKRPWNWCFPPIIGEQWLARKEGFLRRRLARNHFMQLSTSRGAVRLQHLTISDSTPPVFTARTLSAPLQFRNGGADFWIFSDLLLQGF